MQKFLIKLKVALDRGRIWFGYVQFFMLIFITVASMNQFPALASLFSSTYWLILLGIGGTGAIVVFGYIDFKYLKTFQHENVLYARMNPVQQRIFDNQDKILAELAEIRGLKT